MVGRRKHDARCARYPLRAPLVPGWLAGVVGTAAALVALAYLIGEGRGPGWIPREIVATAVRPGPALALASALLVVGAGCFRQLWLERLAWRPGRIEVGMLAACSSVHDADLARLTTSFRQRLATLRLQAPAPVPGAAPEGDFLEVLSRGAVESPSVLGTVLALIRAARPSHAWQVNGTLVERGAAPRFGVTIQVVRLPGEAHPPVTVWASSWDEAGLQAADRATATILTRTRLCRAPWAAWRRFVMPGELLAAYEQAVRFEEERRYDEALDAYFRALEHDPSNMVIRCTSVSSRSGSRCASTRSRPTRRCSRATRAARIPACATAGGCTAPRAPSGGTRW